MSHRFEMQSPNMLGYSGTSSLHTPVPYDVYPRRMLKDVEQTGVVVLISVKIVGVDKSAMDVGGCRCISISTHFVFEWMFCPDNDMCKFWFRLGDPNEDRLDVQTEDKADLEYESDYHELR